MAVLCLRSQAIAELVGFLRTSTRNFELYLTTSFVFPERWNVSFIRTVPSLTILEDQESSMNRRQFLYGTAATAIMSAMPFHAHATEGPVVKTAKGSVRGLIMDGVHVFRGVPCGMPPYEGPYRLALPEPVPSWSGVLDTVAFGDIPLQPDGKGRPLGGGDCLRLNIWTPAPGTSKCPVMVYIPGGGSTRCDNNDVRFDGTAFAQDGVVLVTINYRVNVHGFLKIKGVPSNLALRDMLFALRWVQDNIASFGGDPDKVTVFGQSAGATHITSLISSKASKGLFRRAVLQSPSALSQYPEDMASRVAASLLAFYGVEDSREAVAALSPEKLLTFSSFVAEKNKDPEWCRMLKGNISLFKPYIDGDILLKRPVDAIAEGAARGLDLMAGSAEEEWRLYTVPGGAIDKIGDSDLKNFTDATGYPSDIVERYRKAGRGTSASDIFSALQSDFIFRMPANKVLESQAKASGKVWAYSFGWRSDAANGRMGAAHSLDVPFVFKTHHKDSPRVRSTVGTNPPDALAEAMHSAWVNFATTGNPGWTPFDTDRRMTMRFDVESREVSDPWKTERKNMPMK